MRILLILECTKVAYKRSRKIAAKYLNQIGRRTFENNLSEKALDSMYKELKEIISKNNSIICYKTTLNNKEIIFKLGSQKKFNEDGFFMYKTKTIEPDFTFNSEENYILKLTEIAALFHDIGKANNGFQLTLEYGIKENESVANKYRHELISFYMLLKLINEASKNLNKESSEKIIIEAIIEKIKKPDFNDYLISNDSILSAEGLSFNNFTGVESWSKFPIINSILWLVLTHHKLPLHDENSVFDFSEYQKEKYSSKENPYLQKFEDFLKKIGNYKIDEIFTQFDTDKLKFLEEENFNNKLIANFEFLRNNYDFFCKTVNIENDFKKSRMPSLLTLIARPSLVFSDYKASADKSVSTYTENVAYANTKTENNVNVMCDSLLTHLFKTFNNVKYSLRLFANYSKINDFRNLKKQFIDKITEKQQNIPEKFMWQESACENLIKYQNNDYPFFGVIMAGTGCGKTRASLKFLTALNNKKLRITVGLGLRTLSCQTHKEYTTEIFNKLDKKTVDNEVGLAVGTCLNNLEKIEEHENTTNKNDSEIFDIDNVSNYNGSTSESLSKDDEVDYFIDDNIELENKILNVIAKTNKDKVIINKPIVVMTIDNIMKAFQQDISSNLRYLMRIMSSDFVLDEIDDYDTKDLISISCLIYMLGYFRRKLFISSATVTPEIIKTLFDFYKSGVNDSLYPDKKILYSFINESNVKTNIKDFSNKSGNDFIEDLNAFTKNIYNQTTVKEQSFSKHRISTVGLNNITIIKDAYLTLYQSVKKLHLFNKIDYSDLSISAGFVKFNNIEDSQNFSKFIGEKSKFDKDSHVIWLNYHSNFMNIERFFIEDFLDTNMVRKSKKEPMLNSYFGSENLFKNEYFENHIKIAKELNKKNLIFVLSTTNIIEVGRDHDYDWAIIEPSSIKSIVQSMGRVKRHREINVHSSISSLPFDYSNIMLFDKFLKDIKNKNRENNYLASLMAFPGIQTDRDRNIPIFPITTKFSVGGTFNLLKGSLEVENKYSKFNYTNIKVKDMSDSLFKTPNYFKDLINDDFIKKPSNKYLINDEYELFDLDKSYNFFRLLTIEKFKQEFYLNSNYSTKSLISARHYLEDFNKSIISKMSKDFYSKNKFRKSSMTTQFYFISKMKDLFNDNTILNQDFGNSYEPTFLISQIKNKKIIFLKTPKILLNKNNYENYFFSNKIYFNKMFEHICNKYYLDKNNNKVKFTMLELSLKYEINYNFKYDIGFGRIKL